MLKEIEGIKYLWVCGYSFGALLALQMVLRRTEICGFILISPPLLNYDFVSWLTTCKAKGLVIFGTKDDILPEQAVEAYIQCLKKKMDVKLLPIVGVNHYFTGKIRIVTNEVINFIKRSTLKMKEDENKQILK
jgi:alpha/beta superfamily hydrolase